jgi:hypothetical protein
LPIKKRRQNVKYQRLPDNTGWPPSLCIQGF